MPTFAPEIKVDAVRRFGANVLKLLLIYRLYLKDQILMKPNKHVLK
jgi:threonine dehydratase